MEQASVVVGIIVTAAVMAGATRVVAQSSQPGSVGQLASGMTRAAGSGEVRSSGAPFAAKPAARNGAAVTGKKVAEVKVATNTVPEAKVTSVAAGRVASRGAALGFVSPSARRWQRDGADFDPANGVLKLTVTRGLTVSQLAAALHTSESTVVAANPSLRKRPIMAGTAYLFPTHHRRAVRYTVKSGDTLSEIARDFDVSVTEIRTWNSMRHDALRAGERLLILLGKQGR